MSADEGVLTVVREWVRKAENDLRTAGYTLTMPEDCPTDTVCFHAQQCVEKYLKGFLTFLEIRPPATHNIDVLVSALPSRNRPGLGVRDQDRLTEYATTTRDPGTYEPIPMEEARMAVEIAQRIRRSIREQLPREAIGTQGKGQ